MPACLHCSHCALVRYVYELQNATLMPNPRFPPGQCMDNLPMWHSLGVDLFAAMNVKDLASVIGSMADEERFIAMAVTNAQTHGFRGYNMDKEGSSTGPAEYLPFLTRFATALHAHNMTLTSDVDGCPQGCEGINCSQYRQSPVDPVLLMSWYQGGTGERFQDKVINTTRASSLGSSKTMAGWAGSHWMHNCSTMDFVLSYNVTSIAYWCLGMSALNWALLHEFLTVDPQHPPSVRPCVGGPPGPPVHVTHNGAACLTAPTIAERAPVTLAPCAGDRVVDIHHTASNGTGTGTNGTQVWTMGYGGVLTLNATASSSNGQDTLWCLGPKSMHKGHSPCAVGSLVVLEATRCDAGAFAVVNGTLTSSSCAGLCAAPSPSPSKPANTVGKDVHRAGSGVTHMATSLSLVLVPCNASDAMGFATTPAT